MQVKRKRDDNDEPTPKVICPHTSSRPGLSKGDKSPSDDDVDDDKLRSRHSMKLLLEVKNSRIDATDSDTHHRVFGFIVQGTKVSCTDCSKMKQWKQP